MGDHERIRLVALGGAMVGKSAIIKRFLFSTFLEKYKATVEELYNQEFDFGSIVLKVDILDTAGDLQFPAMRRLSIATAHAFLLIYSVGDLESFEVVKRAFEEIREQRADYEEIPIVVAGNKTDGLSREVELEDVTDWIFSQMPKMRGRVLECSAKENTGVDELFRAFLTLSKIAIKDDSGLRRRSSAYAGSKKKALTPGSASPPAASPQFLTEDAALRSKPRSRSLIRRSSRKAKQQVRDASGGPSDCHVT